MRIAIFTICREASNANGLLSISGAFTNLSIMQTPARLTGSVVIRHFFSAEEEGAYKGLMRFIDPDGHELLRSKIDLQVPIFESDGTGIYMDTVGRIDVTLRRLGEHQFHIGKLDFEPLIFPFYVSQVGR